MKKIEIRKNGSKRVYTVNTEPSKTDQSFKNEADVNNIMARYRKTGQITHLAKHQGSYADVSEIPDLSQALDQVTKAQQAFDALPSELRARFGNSPVNMIEFLQNDNNIDEAIKLGLYKKPKDGTPSAVDQKLDYLVEQSKNLPSQKFKTHKKPTSSITNDDKSNDDD